MPRGRTHMLVEVALTVAMAAVLYAVFRLWLPINAFGGEIALTMVPIMVLSLRRGVVAGVLAGALWGVLQAMAEPQFIVHPAQLVLDYPVAFGLVGITGFGSGAYHRALEREDSRAAAVIATLWSLAGVAARYAAHVLSGVIFFGANAPAGQPVLIFSVVYNATYLLPSALLAVPATVVVAIALERGVPSTTAAAGRS